MQGARYMIQNARHILSRYHRGSYIVFSTHTIAGEAAEIIKNHIRRFHAWNDNDTGQ